ncbi:hypothetical protein EST38_g8251 [Candolleomyces aberdarensis]|uniref:F-box domain-containing protein n=1 Tax=Candolleomyces aberdarensis TaxID=2316362 RepID=A0A4Q2DEU9_9AGAR|nr:hypothetical protein EST38_g8251 [Candolleomyces aberdarensis]
MSPSLMQSLRFSDLPEDVCRMIFELVPELDQETGRSCALVSRKVNGWIEPILYRTLIFELEDTDQLGNLCGVIEDINHGDSTKSPDFFASHVKAIVITNDRQQYATSVLSILKACHNVEMLALWTAKPSGREWVWPYGRDLRDLRDFITSPELSPRWISITSNLFPIDEVRFSHPIFQNATLVELVWEERGDGDPHNVGWDTLRYLPRLSHFSVYRSFYMKGCDRWVRETVDLLPSSVRVFIFWLYPTFFFRDDTSKEFEGVKAIQGGDLDSRAIVAYMGYSLPTLPDLHPNLHPIFRSYNDVVKDSAGVPVGKDFWTLAEEFIEERHRRREARVSLEYVIL